MYENTKAAVAVLDAQSAHIRATRDEVKKTCLVQ